MKTRRFGIVIIGLVLLAAVARLGWRAGVGRERPAAPRRSLPVEDYAPAPPSAEAPANSQPTPARRGLAVPTPPEPGPATTTPSENPPVAKDGVTRERVRSEIQKAFETKLTSYKLSLEQYEQLTDDVMTIREAREKMNALPLTPENAKEHQRLREQLGKAVADFQDVAHISLQEFTEAAQPEEGITKEGDEANGPVAHETPPPDPSEPMPRPLSPSPETRRQGHYGLGGASGGGPGRERLLPQPEAYGSPEAGR